MSDWLNPDVISSWLKTPILGTITIAELITFLVVLTLAVSLARIINAIIRKYLDDSVGKRLSKGISRTIQYILVGAVLVGGSSQILHLDLTALFLSLGILGIAVAFASQQIIQNAIAGLMISIGKPIQIEDWIEVGAAPSTGICRVKDITMMSTVLREASGRIIILPNSQILGGKVVNYSKSGFTILDLTMSVATDSDLGRIRQIVLEEADRDPAVLPKVDEEEKISLSKFLNRRSAIKSWLESDTDMAMFNPVVNVTDIQGTRMKLQIRVWIREVHRIEQIKSGMLEALRVRFAESGIVLRDP